MAPTVWTSQRESQERWACSWGSWSVWAWWHLYHSCRWRHEGATTCWWRAGRPGRGWLWRRWLKLCGAPTADALSAGSFLLLLFPPHLPQETSYLAPRWERRKVKDWFHLGFLTISLSRWSFLARLARLFFSKTISLARSYSLSLSLSHTHTQYQYLSLFLPTSLTSAHEQSHLIN